MNEQKLRATLDALVSHYGHAVIVLGDNTLEDTTNAIRGSKISRDELAALLAFAARRLFNKKSDLVHFSAN